MSDFEDADDLESELDTTNTTYNRCVILPNENQEVISLTPTSKTINELKLQALAGRFGPPKDYMLVMEQSGSRASEILVESKTVKNYFGQLNDSTTKLRVVKN